MRLLRVALESYIMALYATPMVALIPFILSMMGFGFAPKALVVFLFALFSDPLQHGRGRAQPEARTARGRAFLPLGRMGIWRDVLIPYTLPYALTGVRQGIGRGLVGLVAGEFFLSGERHGRSHHAQRARLRCAGPLRLDPRVTILGVVLMGIGRALENHFCRVAGT